MATAANVVDIRETLQVKAPSDVVAYLNMLIYGAPGSGKTYLAGTSSELGPCLFLDVEGGVTTVRKMSGIDVKPIRSMQEAQQVYNDIFLSMKDGEIYYNTIVVDSLTELADLDMKWIMKQAKNANPDKVDEDVPSPREWGKTRNHIRRFVQAMKDLPCHVIFIASLGEQQDEGQPRSFYPSFAGKLKTEVPGFVDIVGYLTAENEFGSGVITRKLQVTGTRRVVAKDRTAALGDLVTEPTIPKMWELINGS